MSAGYGEVDVLVHPYRVCRKNFVRASASRLPRTRATRVVDGLVPFHDFLVEIIHQDPDITLKELQGALMDAHGVNVTRIVTFNLQGKMAGNKML